MAGVGRGKGPKLSLALMNCHTFSPYARGVLVNTV
jgi:hypothetical protein